MAQYGAKIRHFAKFSKRYKNNEFNQRNIEIKKKEENSKITICG